VGANVGSSVGSAVGASVGASVGGSVDTSLLGGRLENAGADEIEGAVVGSAVGT
jgi:hypothetical protein